MMHPRETVVDGASGGAPLVTIINKGEPVEVASTQYRSGRLDIEIDTAVAGALSQGPRTRRAMQSVFGRGPVARGG